MRVLIKSAHESNPQAILAITGENVAWRPGCHLTWRLCQNSSFQWLIISGCGRTFWLCTKYPCFPSSSPSGLCMLSLTNAQVKSPFPSLSCKQWELRKCMQNFFFYFLYLKNANTYQNRENSIKTVMCPAYSFITINILPFLFHLSFHLSFFVDYFKAKTRGYVISIHKYFSISP